MSKVKKFAMVVLVLVLVTFLSVRIYLHHDLPLYSGSLVRPGLVDTVEVYTDQYGVPHILARNEGDLFFAAGYIAARERLFQLTTVAASVRGELALLLGDDLVKSDIYLRTWRIPEMGRRLAAALDTDTAVLVEAFCRGINSQIAELGRNLPLEFKLLRVKPIQWQPSDVAGYARLMAHELQSSWKSEVVYGAVGEYWGAEKLAEILPAYEDHRPTIAAQQGKDFLPRLYSAVQESEAALREITGMSAAAIGSNSWVISGSRTANGKPLLANDPHLEFAQPPRWYEMHLKGGRFDVSGVCLAGIPVPVIGQNEACAWGFTNSMADDLDFFLETIHPDNPNRYLSGERWLDMELAEERIPLKSGGDTTVVVRLTHHGPVISDIHPLLRKGDQAVSMSWTGHRLSNEIGVFFKLNLMGNWDDFSAAVEDYGVPGQNMVYADTAGNIGWRPAVHLPLRIEGNSLTPRPGKNPEYDWQGIIPYEEMPYLLNPGDGYIVSANNKTIGDEFPYYVSNLWADPSRAERILELIQGLEGARAEDMEAIQLDVVSPFAREITPYLLAAATGREEGNLKTALDLLRTWDGEESPQSPAALVFHVTLNKLVRNIYGDELEPLGTGYLEALAGLKYLNSRNLRRLLREDSSSWFDDLNTPDRVETRDEIIRRSLQEAVDDIEQRAGSDPRQWTWGQEHTLTHPHLLGDVALLEWLFDLNVGPYPSGGSDKTPNAGGYSFNRPYRQIAGPSMRRVVDFSDLDRTRFILPTGQSGLSHSPHYNDQAPLYHSGQYRITHFDEAYIRSSDDYQHLVLAPEE